MLQDNLKLQNLTLLQNKHFHEKNLANHLKPTIGDQHFGDIDTVYGLVIFQDARQYPGQCQRASVQGMGQLALSSLVLVAELEAIGLKGFKIGH